MARGFVLAAPASGSGKTLITLALLSLFRTQGHRVRSCKAGPDYIDPAFHEAATGAPSWNLDPWAMRADLLRSLFTRQAESADLLLIEGAMGLFDGIGAGGRGSSAELARLLDLPVLLVMPARGQGATITALLDGLIRFDPALRFAGIIFNRVGGPHHRAILKIAAESVGLPMLGAIPTLPDLTLPDRHLGLVQAGEYGDLPGFLAKVRALMADHLDLEGIIARAAGIPVLAEAGAALAIPPLGQRIAFARDSAFAFAYDWQIRGWRDCGAEILPFSPLADEAPAADADAIFLPGGYPELHAGTLAGNRHFLDGLRAAAKRGARIYGECGGYMVLGQGLVDGAGARHAMAGLLPVETSFAEPRLTLGYRQAVLLADNVLGKAGTRFRGHEFHYSSALREGRGEPLFAATDAHCRDLGTQGRREGSVAGSYLHLIDRTG